MRKSTRFLAFGVALAVCLNMLQHSAFVTPPRHTVSSLAAATAAATLSAAPALSDPIDDAAKELSSAAYPFLKDLDWNSPTLQQIGLTKPGAGSADAWTKACGKAIDMGAAMDPASLIKGVDAHHQAIASALNNAKGVTSEADFERINAALGHMIASVPESKVMAVYNAFGALVSPDVPKYLMSTVKAADAEAAYAALMKFKDVVKANPQSVSSASSATAVTPAEADKIDAAAQKLSVAAYPFLKDVDWNTDVPMKVSGYSTNAKQLIKAVDKALVMGSAMDPNALKAAALAHVKAIGSTDGSGVTTQEDFKEIIAGLGKAIASVPEAKVMAVYNSFKDVVNSGVPKYLMSTVKEGDAKAAYSSLMDFKNVVKSAM